MDLRPRLVMLVREQSGAEDGERREALEQLATRIDALPKSHPAARVLTHMRGADADEFPSDDVRSLVAAYPDSDRDEDGFLLDVIDVYHPGMGRAPRRGPKRPWWSYYALGGLAGSGFWHLARKGRKICPDCAERVKEGAKVCRYCGHRFDGS